jgi:hypothetical protein
MALEGALNSFDFIARLSKAFAVDHQCSRRETEHSIGVLIFSRLPSDSVGNQR